jgi:Tetratricopeptide repeat
MYLRALAGNETVLGHAHTSTLNIFNDLGLMYNDQGKLAEAEQMLLQALEHSSGKPNRKKAADWPSEVFTRTKLTFSFVNCGSQIGEECVAA